MNISYDQAVTFHAVARRGSFSLAAKDLYRSQSAVSIQVAKLEGEIGSRCFIALRVALRSPRREKCCSST